MGKNTDKILTQMEDALEDIKLELRDITDFAKSFKTAMGALKVKELEQKVDQLQKGEDIIDTLTDMTSKLDMLFTGQETKRFKAFRAEQEKLLDEAVSSVRKIREALTKLAVSQSPKDLNEWGTQLGNMLKNMLVKGVKVEKHTDFEMGKDRFHFATIYKLLTRIKGVKHKIYITSTQDVMKKTGNAQSMGMNVFHQKLPRLPYSKSYPGAGNVEIAITFIANAMNAFGVSAILSPKGKKGIKKLKPSKKALDKIKLYERYASVEVSKMGNVVRFVMKHKDAMAYENGKKVDRIAKSHIKKAQLDASLIVLAKRRKLNQAPVEIRKLDKPGLGKVITIVVRFFPKSVLDYIKE